MLALSNGLDKINTRLRRHQFTRWHTRVPDVIAVQWTHRSLGGSALDLVISGGGALSRGLDRPRDRAAGKGEPASRHMRVTIPSAEPVARSYPNSRAAHLLRALGPCFSAGAAATKDHDADRCLRSARSSTPHRCRESRCTAAASGETSPVANRTPSRLSSRRGPGGPFPAKLCATMWQASP